MEEDRLATNLSRTQDLEAEPEIVATPEASTRTPKKRFVGRRTAAEKGVEGSVTDGVASSTAEPSSSTAIQPAPARRLPRALNRVPPEIQEDKDLQTAVALLPPNYDFEIFKTVHRIRTQGAKHIGLQLPEGLLLFATTLADIFARFGAVREADGRLGVEPKVSILGDVTYGACCVDDFTARALGCDLLVHYAHSCLIPRAGMSKDLSVLYVFVDIGIDSPHLLETVTRNFKAGSTLALMGTVQFNAALHALRTPLEQEGFTVVVPQAAPLSRGELLGCTAPTLTGPKSITSSLSSKSNVPLSPIDALLYLGDGRFHLESAMIANPTLPAYRYDPYSRTLTREHYEHTEMRSLRADAIASARKAQHWGLILGALGRQGNPATLALIERVLQSKGREITKMVLSEVTPSKLALLPGIDVWVQVACPRLSIDWGYAFPKPLLSPYEALVALDVREAKWEAEAARKCDKSSSKEAAGLSSRTDTSEEKPVYPMDYYAKDGLGRVTVADVERGDGLVKVGG